jgi:hypothetical protein
MEASSGFGPAGRNGGEAAEAQTGVVGAGVQGEARGGVGQGDGTASDQPIPTAALL